MGDGEHSALETASLGSIFATGLLLGLIHVLTGPDHLSAIAAMASNSSWKAFGLGIRWGCGHSIGLIIMAVIFFAAGQHFDLDKAGEYCNYIVGVFMIALGLWTMYYYHRQFKKHQAENQMELAMQASLPAHDASVPQEGIPVLVSPVPMPPVRVSNQDDDTVKKPKDPSSTCTNPGKVPVPNTPLLDEPTAEFHAVEVQDHEQQHHEDNDQCHDHDNDVPHLHCCCCTVKTCDFSNPTAQKFTALAVGIVHGIAGPGGVLGVLPAVVLDDWVKSTMYLGSFCLSLVLTMGILASLYGEATGRVTRNSFILEYRIGMVSASFSLIVGVVWIVLQSCGVMGDIFE